VRCSQRTAGFALLAAAVLLASCKPTAPHSSNTPLQPAQTPAKPAPVPVATQFSNPLVKRASDGVLELDWLALMSAADRRRLESGDWLQDSGDSHPGQEGSFRTNMAERQIKGFAAIHDFDHQRVRVAGYFVPLEQTPTGAATEILFVPYFGACIHVPPPPANQIIYAKLGIANLELSMFEAYWLEGTIVAQTNASSVAVAGYTILDGKLSVWE
jgi:uncharacterized protein